jgi:hypothetical protein
MDLGAFSISLAAKELEASRAWPKGCSCSRKQTRAPEGRPAYSPRTRMEIQSSSTSTCRLDGSAEFTARRHQERPAEVARCQQQVLLMPECAGCRRHAFRQHGSGSIGNLWYPHWFVSYFP